MSIVPEPVEGGLEYHRLHRLGGDGGWRPILGVLLLLAGIFVFAPISWTAAFVVWFALTGEPIGEGLDRVLDLGDVTPAGLAYVNLVLATAIPVALLVTIALHQLHPNWLLSVARRLRWTYLLVCVGLSVVALIATLIVTMLVPAQGGADIAGEPNEFTTTTRNFLLVVLLLTPLQAAGEEFAFRGYLTQAAGGLVRGLWASRVVAVVLPALLFALAHGLGQDLPVFIDRFAFGLVAGALVIRTGGLEAGIAMHVLNNFLAFGLALAYTDMTSALNPTGGSWWSLPATLTQSLVFYVLAARVADRMGLARTAEPPERRHVLEGSAGRV